MTLPADTPAWIVLIVGALAWIAREVWPWWSKRMDTTAEQARRAAEDERKARQDTEERERKERAQAEAAYQQQRLEMERERLTYERRQTETLEHIHRFMTSLDFRMAAVEKSVRETETGLARLAPELFGRRESDVVRPHQLREGDYRE